MYKHTEKDISRSRSYQKNDFIILDIVKEYEER